jgi:hypothetical protein
MKYRTKQKGGATNHVPKPVTDLPEIKTPEELLKNMNFYSIVGHGAINERDKGKLYLVPERTYIMFTARAGEPTAKIKPTVDEILNNFRYKQKDSTKATGLEDDIAWATRAYGQMNNGSLFKELLFDPSLEDNTERVSIYQPGDLIQDLIIQFHNQSPPWDPVGMWKLPMDPKTEDLLQSVRNDFDDQREALYKGEGKKIVDDITNYFNDKKGQLAAQGMASGVPQKVIDSQLEEIEDIYQYLLYYHRLSEPEKKLMEKNKMDKKLTTILERNGYLYNLKKGLDKLLVELIIKNEKYQQEFDTQPNNQLQLLLHTGRVKQEDRQVTLHELLRSFPPSTFNATTKILKPAYNFFIIDICRSLSGKDYFYPSAKRLVRRLSNVMRFAPNINISGQELPKFNTILKLTRTELQKLMDASPASNTGQKHAVLTELLKGETVTHKQLEQLFGNIEEWEGAFEEFIKYHRFDKGDEAFIIFEATPAPAVAHLDNKKVIIQSVMTTTKGTGGNALYYKVSDPSSSDGKIYSIFNRILWKSAADREQALEERTTMTQEKKKINNLIKKGENSGKQQEFAKVIRQFTDYGKAINEFKLGDTVEIDGIQKRPELNKQKGYIDGASTTPTGNLLYHVVISSTDKGLQGTTHSILHTNLTKVTMGGRRKTRRIKSKKSKKTRKH